MDIRQKKSFFALPIILIVSRLLLMIAMPVDGLRGYGDFIHFYRLAGMGIPFIDYWVEFPPIFPFISALIFNISSGRQHVYDYLLIIILTIAQAISLFLFVRLAGKMFAEAQLNRRSTVYFAILISLSYGWWYFDPLAELAVIAALVYLLEEKDIRSAVFISLGALTKLFPILLLPLAWRILPLKKAIRTTIISLSVIIGVYGLLYFSAPEMTRASILSQTSKGSWETPWALIDRNFGTGNFGPENERFDPIKARLLRGNPPKISPWLTLLPFAGIGGLIFWKAKLDSTRNVFALFGITWSIFLIWSPGWSPQWLIYLIPLILLTLPERQAYLFSFALVFVNLLEWPVLLSRGLNMGLWLTVTLRTFLFCLMAIIWTGMIIPRKVMRLGATLTNKNST